MPQAESTERNALVAGAHPVDKPTRWVLLSRSGEATELLKEARLHAFSAEGEDEAGAEATIHTLRLGRGWTPFIAHVLVRGDWLDPNDVTPAWVRKGHQVPALRRYPFHSTDGRLTGAQYAERHQPTSVSAANGRTGPIIRESAAAPISSTDAHRRRALVEEPPSSPPRLVPWWAWPLGVLIAFVCYEVNRGGHGWISFIATVTLCRLFVTGSNKDEPEAMKWAAAFVVAFVGTLGYGLVGNLLWPDRVPLDSDLGLLDREPMDYR